MATAIVGGGVVGRGVWVWRGLGVEGCPTEYTSSFTLASTINMFFIDKINTIKMEFPLLEACLPVYSFVDIDIIMPACTTVFDTFHPLSCDVLSSLISKLNKTTCVLDPFPTKLLMSHLFLYYRYYSMYCESMFLVWCFSNSL